MEQNIFQVVKEDHLDEILTNYMQNLVLIMLSSKTCTPCRTIKPKFVDLSKKNKDTVFIYIDRDNYELSNNKYFTQFKYTPTFVFYFGKNQIAYIEGAHEEALVKTIALLKQKIEEKKKEFVEKERALEEQKLKELQNAQIPSTQSHVIQVPPSQPSELLKKKMDLLNQFKLLAENGIPVPKFNLDSDYEEMVHMFKSITDPLNTQLHQSTVSHTSTVSNDSEVLKNKNMEELKKQEQIRQIQELDKLNQKLQPQTLQKLQHLKKIMQMKEQQEKNNKNV